MKKDEAVCMGEGDRMGQQGSVAQVLQMDLDTSPEVFNSVRVNRGLSQGISRPEPSDCENPFSEASDQVFDTGRDPDAHGRTAKRGGRWERCRKRP